jgi:dimethylargininase
VFRKAIVRVPGSNFSQGLSTGIFGVPILSIALEQHRSYCEALKDCGLSLVTLPPDLDYPDSTFVEDTAVLVRDFAIFLRPGAISRRGEVEQVRPIVHSFFEQIEEIVAPGTLDGGDICEADNHFFIGISERTNVDGAKQFRDIVGHLGYTSDLIDIRGVPGLLHLKSGLAYLGDGNLVAIDSLNRIVDHSSYRKIPVGSEENYAANCVRVNDKVLFPKGFPKLSDLLENLGYSLVHLDMSEFQKMDGGLSCLSLRF